MCATPNAAKQRPCTSVVVSFRFEGYHCWPLATGDVSFLRERHRHEFHVRATKRVKHFDRDVEIIDLKRRMREYAERTWQEAGNASCEVIAYDLLNKFGLRSCEVLEDGENGAVVSVTEACTDV